MFSAQVPDPPVHPGQTPEPHQGQGSLPTLPHPHKQSIRDTGGPWGSRVHPAVCLPRCAGGWWQEHAHVDTSIVVFTCWPEFAPEDECYVRIQ